VIRYVMLIVISVTCLLQDGHVLDLYLFVLCLATLNSGDKTAVTKLVNNTQLL